MTQKGATSEPSKSGPVPEPDGWMIGASAMMGINPIALTKVADAGHEPQYRSDRQSRSPTRFPKRIEPGFKPFP